ncbi:hypothetical protein J7E64_28215 [Priestia megaterium]|nr:hypothetical protein [Priestia megaterium]
MRVMLPIEYKLEIPDITRVNFYLVTELNQIEDLGGLIKGTIGDLESILEAKV